MRFNDDFDPRGHGVDRLTPPALGFPASDPSRPAISDASDGASATEPVAQHRFLNCVLGTLLLLRSGLGGAAALLRTQLGRAAGAMRSGPGREFLAMAWHRFGFAPSLAGAVALLVGAAATALDLPSPWAAAFAAGKWTLIVAAAVALLLHARLAIRRLAAFR